MRDVMKKIISETKERLESRKKHTPLSSFKSKLKKSDRSFKKAISQEQHTNIIAEIKFASPSVRDMANPKNLKNIAKIYDSYAAAISVLTEEKFFKGKLEYLREVRKITDVPLLQKDFILDEYQIYEARRYGADAVLLIAHLLSVRQLNKFIAISKKLGIDCLVEVHSLNDLKKALKANIEILGINNRSLRTMKVNISTTPRLLKKIPKSRLRELIIVSESGFASREQIESMPKQVSVFLVGTYLMLTRRVQARLKELAGLPLVKICGITNKRDALAAAKFGADILGFVFYGPSPRYVSPEKVKKIIASLPRTVQTAGIFVDHDLRHIHGISTRLRLDYVQLHGDEHLTSCGSFPNTIKAIRVSSKKDIAMIGQYTSEFVLLDASVKGKYGGTGRTFDWELAKALGKKADAKLFLAGGLSYKNVKRAIRIVRPYAVDASSKLEKKPGIKDHAKIKAFIEAVYS